MDREIGTAERKGSTAAAGAREAAAWHALGREEVACELGVSVDGIDDREAALRMQRFGPNRIDPPPPPSRWRIFLRQFQSPLIYVLVGAAVLAVGMNEILDAAFIAAVLLINAVIGFANEVRAEREMRALGGLVRTRARVHRGTRTLDLDAEEIVPGDLVLLESGARVPADLRLVASYGLRVDESLLTGESVPVEKDAEAVHPPETELAERRNMGFAGTLVASGRGMGLVVATATRTEVGAIAGQVGELVRELPPLLQRMEIFAHRLGLASIGLAAVVVAIGWLQGQPIVDLLFGAVALVVSAIPEGLPIALTVALAVAVARMAERRVVVRHLPAVEALGSCGVIATDKTGTLTRNELTVEHITCGDVDYTLPGVGYAPDGEIHRRGRPLSIAEHPRLFRLLRAGCLTNEGSLARREDGAWEWSGDPTDVALLSAAIKASLDPTVLCEDHETLASIPFEPELRYSASYHARDGAGLVCAKGAPERILDLCRYELREDGTSGPLDRDRALRSVERWMREGYRVLALADAETPCAVPRGSRAPEPSDLVFLGLVAMTDPPREGVREAIERCRRAGIHVAMVTGDHATTALAIAERIGLAAREERVLTGPEIAALSDDDLVQQIGDVSVIARATPFDKLRAVRAWRRRGAFVTVTGDGVNDAPALRQANLGVAMGRGGTDVAREAADLVITDDDFSTIVAGVEEGRFAYDNVRKVTHLLVSTGLGEVLAVLGALALGLPFPFTAVQLLWLNLVTNGIQGVALAFEPGEPGALDRPPRPPAQGIFDRSMLERTLLAGIVFGIVSVVCWTAWMEAGMSLGDARNQMVQLFVLFEIFHIGNARSETRSLFALSPLRNPMLFVGTLGAVGLHVAALLTPVGQKILGLAMPTIDEIVLLAALGLSVVVAMELYKAFRYWRPLPS